jgi:hypothetical protein
MRTTRIVALVAGALAALLALGLLAGGGVLLWAHATQRDGDGYYTAPTGALRDADLRGDV